MNPATYLDVDAFLRAHGADDLALRLDAERMDHRRVSRALDEIAADAREDARLAAACSVVVAFPARRRVVVHEIRGER